MLTTHLRKRGDIIIFPFPSWLFPILGTAHFLWVGGGGVELGEGIPKASGKFRGNYRCTADLHDHLPPPPQIFQNIIYTVAHNAQLHSIAVV